MGFRARLAEVQKKKNSLVCVGLDPILAKAPKTFRVGDRRTFYEHDWQWVSTWMINIVDAVAPFTSLFKPQRAHYEAIEGGERALRAIVNYIHSYHPDIPVFLDCKRGDIGRTQQRYRDAHFRLDGVDGMNFNPYMGKDCMEFLVDKDNPGKAIVGLCYTSNSSARQMQDITLFSGRRYWEFVAETVLKWATDLGVVEDAGLVMAAAYEKSGKIYSEQLWRCREIVGEKLWFLIPGIGTQGGFVKETVNAAFTAYGSIAINSSSGIIFASDGDDYAKAAANKAEELRDQIRAAF